MSPPRAAVVVVTWNGARWLPGLLGSLAAQTRPHRLVVVDNGSTDGSLDLVPDDAVVLALGRNTGFAAAANRGIEAADGCEHVALVNTDVELAPDWLARMGDALEADPARAAVACKMVALDDPGALYDTGDRLRRDGVAEQRGRFSRDDGRFDAPGDVWGACAGAALYRRRALVQVGGFDERLFAYLEDVDLALRLRLAGWTCGYEPVVARHAGEGSSWQLRRDVGWWMQRNTLLLVAKAFPARWLPLVAYRQAAWVAASRSEGRLGPMARGTLAALPHLPAVLRERRRLRRSSVVPVTDAVPPAPILRRTGADAPPRSHRRAT